MIVNMSNAANTARAEIIADFKTRLLNVEGNVDAAYYLSESLSEEWGAGIHDSHADVFFRAQAALERIMNGGSALK